MSDIPTPDDIRRGYGVDTQAKILSDLITRTSPKYNADKSIYYDFDWNDYPERLELTDAQFEIVKNIFEGRGWIITRSENYDYSSDAYNYKVEELT